MVYSNTSFKRRNPDKLRAARAQSRERAERCEAIAARWGLSTRRPRPTPEGWGRLGQTERLCRECMEALEAGGDRAAVVAALSSLAVAEWRALMRRIADEFNNPRCVIWRCAPIHDDIARIEYALERFPPDAQHWLEARKRLALTTTGPTLDDDPAIATLRAVSGFDREEALPCDQTLRALCEAIALVFRADYACRRLGAGGGR
jgi:hypothetical protein